MYDITSEAPSSFQIYCILIPKYFVGRNIADAKSIFYEQVSKAALMTRVTNRKNQDVFIILVPAPSVAGSFEFHGRRPSASQHVRDDNSQTANIILL